VGSNIRIWIVLGWALVSASIVSGQNLLPPGVPGNAETSGGLTTTGDGSSTGPLILDGGTYAVFHSSEGDFIVKLLTKEAPQAVQSFVGLSTGKKKWKHPVTGKESDRPLFNNTLIYRAIEDSLICGGDPINKGTGDAGYQLPLEKAAGLEFNQPGLLAMDVNGSSASSSRWFITLRPFPDWTGQFTIFGKMVGGLNIVRKIASRPTKRPQLPLDPVIISSIEILELPVGKQVVARFETEMGRSVLSVDSEFSDAAKSNAPSSDADVGARSAETTVPAPGAAHSETSATAQAGAQ